MNGKQGFRSRSRVAFPAELPDSAQRFSKWVKARMERIMNELNQKMLCDRIP